MSSSDLLNFEIETADFDLMVRELARAADRPLAHIVRAESAAVLQTALNRTKAPSKSLVTKRRTKAYNTFAPGGAISRRVAQADPHLSITKSGERKWLVTHSRKTGKLTFYIMAGGYKEQHWSDAKWNEFTADESNRQSAFKADLADHIARRGLPKQSWFQLGAAIGARLQAAGWVVNASVHGRTLTGVVQAMMQDLESNHSITFRNESRATYFAGGARVLERVLAGRIKYFQKNAEHEVFQELDKLQKAYPWILKLEHL